MLSTNTLRAVLICLPLHASVTLIQAVVSGVVVGDPVRHCGAPN